MLDKYLDFLEYFMGNINSYFESQAPYIKCEKGCAKCCSNGDYPFSQIELELLKQGFFSLDETTQNIIKQKIADIKKAKNDFSDKDGTFTYECPFLIDNICSVYPYRGIICRTFGLIYLKEGSKMQIPFCAYEGLNYSNVLDKEKDMLTAEKMTEQGIETMPKAYNIHYDFVTSEKVGKAFDIDFGKRASLIDLLSEDDSFN